MEVGDIVKLVETIATTKSDGKTIFIRTNERFVVLNSMGSDVQISLLGRSLEIVIGRHFLEVQSKPKGSKSLGRAALNEGKGKMPKDTIVKIGVNELTDACEWAHSNGYDIELNSDECFTVNLETTKTVYIKSNERKGLVRLPKRFLEEVEPEQIKLNKQDILALIDIAIDTGDEEWFYELHSKLNTL